MQHAQLHSLPAAHWKRRVEVLQQADGRLFVSDSLLMAFVTPLRLLAPLAASQVRSAAWCSSAVVMSSRFGLSHHPVWMVHPMDDTACAGLSCRQLPRHPVCEGRGA